MSRPPPHGGPQDNGNGRMTLTNRKASKRSQRSQQSQQNSARSAAEWDALDNIPQGDAGYMEDIRPRRERTRQDDYLYYSLAGPPAPPPRYDQHQAYFDPGYLGSNPWMQQEEENPNFTLARNFPRIVRWKGKAGERDVEADQKGESETAPQVEAAEDMGAAVAEGDEDHGNSQSGPSTEVSVKS